MDTKKEIISAFSKSKTFIITYIWVFIAIAILGIVWYYHRQINKKENNNISMKANYKNRGPELASINPKSDKYILNQKEGIGHIRDYYIASSYNSCCAGNFQNDYVDLDPLKEVIFQGARVLDFEIYKVNGDIVGGAGSTNNMCMKGTYNVLSLGGSASSGGVLKNINNWAFSRGSCPNPEDPLFIHFRIKSDHKDIYDKLTKYVKDAFTTKLLGPEYAFERKNIGQQAITGFMGKVVIICDQINNNYTQNKNFYELVNMSSNSPFFKELRNYDIQYTHNAPGLEDFNKKNICMTMPDLSALNGNPAAALSFSYGCQMVCMNYSNLDKNMIYYLKQFNNAKSAFILKPKELRYIPVMIKKPPPQNPQLSFAPKKIDLPMYKTTI